MLRDGLVASTAATTLEAALATGEHARLAMLTGTKVIHIAERDTQISDRPKEVDEFVNTWSVEGFYEEGIAPAEIGWGTHEKRLPRNAHVHTGEGPRNQICLAQPGMETWVRTWVPSGPNIGMVVRHGESFTMSDHLTVHDELGPARSTGRRSTTRTTRPTSRSTACSSCGCATGRCSRASGSSTTRSSAVATSSACC